MKRLPWDDDKTSKTGVKQSNTVMSSAVRERGTGRHKHTPINEILYDMISCRLASRKFYAQRQLTIEQLKCTLLVYFTGRVVCAGTEGLLDACAAMAGAIYIMSKYQREGGSPFTLGSVATVNCVSHGEFEFGLSLACLYTCLYDAGLCVSYTPDAFRGIRLWIDMKDECGDKRVALLFATGKFILTGFKTIETTERAAEYLIALINSYPSTHVNKSEVPMDTVDEDVLESLLEQTDKPE